MVPLLVCSLLVVYVAIERFLLLRRARVDAGPFMMKVRSIFRGGDVAAVMTFCSRKDTPLACVVGKGLEKFDQGGGRMREAIEEAGRSEVFQLEQRLSWLATIAAVAPMIGFLGTLGGLIGVFRGVEALGGGADQARMAGGIWTALLPAAFGLLVGIPALVVYNSIVSRVGRFMHELEGATSEFLDLLERANVSGPVPPDLREAPSAAAMVLDDDQFFRPKA